VQTEKKLDSQTTLKTDHQLVEDQRLVLNGHCPLFVDIAVCQEKQFTSRFRGGKNAFRCGDFAQLTMVAFHRVGGIDQAADLKTFAKDALQQDDVTVLVLTKN
jgi:hypothetical protein